MTDPRVFVGIPTYQRPEFVRRSLHSVLQQTFTRLRVVVSDNASEPSASAAAERFVRESGDPRASFHRQPRNVFESGQGRFFFEQCEEPYLVILHDDDFLRPEYLETAIGVLEAHPEAACYCADPEIVDQDGRRSEEETRDYLRGTGRVGRPEGLFPILETVLEYGLPPISGTVFRTSELRRSGFSDPDFVGNYPFELDVITRLGEGGRLGWYDPRELLCFAFHGGNQRNGWLFDERYVGPLITLLEGRRWSGRAERSRRRLMVELLRRRGVVKVLRGDLGGGRREILDALRRRPTSPKSWCFAAAALAFPPAVRAFGRLRSGGRIGSPSDQPEHLTS